MHRRLLLSALACCPAAVLAQEADSPRPRHKIGAAQLYEALSARFPLRLGVLGLVQLQVSAPQLLLLPARNKIGATLQALASGPAVQRGEAGEADLVFSLRYAGEDKSIRAYQPEIIDLRLPNVPGDAAQRLKSLLPAFTRDAVGEVVLHRLTPRELALPDTMGFEPDKLTVQEDGVVIVFGPKPRP
jgi:hypothetical protein